MLSSVVFTFDDMISSLKSAMRKFPDTRIGKNRQYDILDAALGSFSMFFTQCPSMLEHQKLMQERYGMSNAKTLFGMQDIPSDTHIRDLLDQVPAESLSSVFTACFKALKSSGDLDTYRVALGTNNNDLLLALDGTQYFSSTEISCTNCSKKTIDEEIHYAHSMVTPTIVAPGNNKVISLTPSFITPHDGEAPSSATTDAHSKKQDSELKASKRWLKSNSDIYRKEGITILGDDLYAHEPFCRNLLEVGFNFILVCKPESHKTVYEWVKGITNEYVEDRFDGKKHLLYTYNYALGVPLKEKVKKDDEPLLVNFVEVTVTERATGKKLYHNAFITNHPLGKTEKETKEILGTIVDCGRARWKIENENNNTLKTQGYHLEHNFGHGKKHLASLFAMMNLLAFLFHTILELMDEKYQLLRKVFGARKRLFESIRVLLIYHPYKSFSTFMDFMIAGLKRPFPLEELHYPL